MMNLCTTPLNTQVISKNKNAILHQIAMKSISLDCHAYTIIRFDSLAAQKKYRARASQLVTGHKTNEEWMNSLYAHVQKSIQRHGITSNAIQLDILPSLGVHL